MIAYSMFDGSVLMVQSPRGYARAVFEVNEVSK